MRQLLTGKGFSLYKQCGCSGGKEWFKRTASPGLEVILHKRGNKFEIKHNHQIVKRGHQDQLPLELSNYIS